MNHTILDHLDQCFNELMKLEPKKSKYKFTVRYQDGDTSEIAFETTTREKAVAALSYWVPGCIEILDCEVTRL